MVWRVVEALFGVLIVLGTMLDVFLTIIVPGRVSIGPRTTALVRRVFLPIWVRAARRAGKARAHAILGTFAGAMLVSVFLLWLAMILLGFAMTAHALDRAFTPPLGSFAEALFQVGTAMTTLGLSGHQATGWARLPIFLAGLCGLLVITLTLTYIVQIQSALQRREPLVLLLPVRAGLPPSGLQLLLVTRELRVEHRLGHLFEQWEAWAGDVLLTYGAWPALIYFRSQAREANWLAALNAMLDASVLVQFLENAGSGEARLFYRAGIDVIGLLCRTLNLPAEEPPTDNGPEWMDQVRRLSHAGYALAERRDRSDEMKRMRDRYEGHIRALARHLDLPIAQTVNRGRNRGHPGE